MRATSLLRLNDEDRGPPKTVADILVFRTRAECLKIGGKLSNFDDMLTAQARVLRADPELARAYYDDQNQEATEDQSVSVGRASFTEGWGSRIRRSEGGRPVNALGAPITVGDLLTAVVERECRAMGGSITSFDDMMNAHNRVLTRNKLLANAYQWAPNDEAPEDILKEVGL